MDGFDVTDVCRLCPAKGKNQALLNIFDEGTSIKNNMKEVILVTTGIEILENDLVSKKICQRCCNITLKMFQFRQDALKQDRVLKEKCGQYLEGKGIHFPNTCITIKQEKLLPSIKQFKKEPVAEACSKTDLHPSITLLYQTFPHLKLPEACVDQHMTPVVSLPMGEVEKYFINKKLDMKKFIYKRRRKSHNMEHSDKVTKKRTTMPTKQTKTIAPLKISKKLFGNHKESISDFENYVCTSVKKKKGERKRSTSSSDFDKKLENQPDTDNNERLILSPKFMDVAESAVALAVSTRDNFRSITPAPETPSVSEFNKNEKTITVWSSEPSEDSRDSLASNISVVSASDKEHMNTLKSCRLTPTVTPNEFELERHNNKDLVCQFCKERFNSLNAKHEHIDYDCGVKKIMNSSYPIISLEQIHLNLDIRKKYKEAFLFFESIAGLQEPKQVEEVMVNAVLPPPLVYYQDSLIELSDDDETHCVPPDPLSNLPTSVAHPVAAAVETVVYNTVSIVRPEVRIKNSQIQCNPTSNLTDKEVITDLVELFELEKSKVEKMLQTDLPTNRDIKVNNLEGTCEFKNLKEQLLNYKVPININYGAFHVGYQFKKKNKTSNRLDNWNTLPLVKKKKKCVRTTNLNKSHNNDNNVTLSGTRQPVTISSSQHYQSTLSISSSIPITTTQIKTNTSSTTPIIPFQIKPNTAVCLTPPVVLNNQITAQPITNQFPINFATSNSPTPVLQHYVLSIPSSLPTAKTSLPNQKTFANSPFNNKNVFQNPSRFQSVPVNKPYSRLNSLPLLRPRVKATSTDYSVPVNGMSTTNSLSTSTSTTSTSEQSANQPSSSTGNTTITQVTRSEPSKFRVKNVWELQ